MESLVSHGVLAPPTVFILLAIVGALLALRWRGGAVLALLANLCLYAAATPALSSWLLHQVEAGLPIRPDLTAAQAIVVLGGDVRGGNGGDIPDALGPFSFERVAFAAAAYRRLHLPVAISGGVVGEAHTSEAVLMREALEQQFAVPVMWIDAHSRTTWENAVDTARLLRPGIGTVVVVSQAWHLPRAVWAFEKVGLKALPWPAPRTAIAAAAPGDFAPSPGALADTFHALHEMIGLLYYRLRHRA